MKDETRRIEFVGGLLRWGSTHLREFPWRSTGDPLEILVAEVLLQKTPADRVASRYDGLMSTLLLESEMLDEESLIDTFRELGLTKRAKWLLRARKMIDKRFDGSVPRTREDLVSLPGVGLYTANAVLCFAFGQSVPIVDTNVARILARVFDVQREGASSLKSELYVLASLLVPEKNAKLYNLSLLDLGALVCRKQPLCGECPVGSMCSYYAKNG